MTPEAEPFRFQMVRVEPADSLLPTGAWPGVPQTVLSAHRLWESLQMQEELLTGKVEYISQLQNGGLFSHPERSCRPVFKLGMLVLAWHLSTPMAG